MNNANTTREMPVTGNAAGRSSAGFTLVELLVAMLVGILIVGGAFSMHATSRKTQVSSEAQMDMVADARFAIELIAHDLRHAGMWGGTSKSGVIDCKSTDPVCAPTATGDTPPAPMANDCAPGWYYDLTRPIFASDGDISGNPYQATCIPDSEGYVAGTDILEIKYADSNPPVALLGNQTYVRSNAINGRLFVGATPPELDAYDSNPLTDNHELNAYAYYVSDFTDSAGDGIPSLRRVALQNSASLQNQVLLSGVADLQVQFGEDIDGDAIIDHYVNPDLVADWNEVYAARIWLLMRTDREMEGVDTTKNFTMAGNSDDYGGVDDFRFFMVSSVVSLRNMQMANLD